MNKKFSLILIWIFLIIIFLETVFATLNVSLSDQGTNVIDKTTGNLLNPGNLKVEIYDNLTGGTLIYTETFAGAIINGSWNVMLGENSSNSLDLEFGKIYYKDYEINGLDLDFTNLTGDTVERQFFYSPLGDISGEDVSQSANLTIANINTTNTGFFGYLGSLASRIAGLFVTDINASGNVDVGGYINVTGTSYFTNASFNGGWTNGGVSISDGDIFAQTIYVYNLTALSLNTLSINGSLLPAIGFDNTFDIGNSSLRWKDLYLSGHVYSNGTGDNYFLGSVGIGTGSPSAKLQIKGDPGLWWTPTTVGDNDFMIWTTTDEDTPRVNWTYNPVDIDLELKYYDGTEVMTWDINAGNVGIGTTSPAAKVDVVGTIRTTGQTIPASGEGIEIQTAAGNGYIIHYDRTNTNYEPLIVRGSTLSLGDASSATAMFIDSSGKVGIGTTSPINHLDIRDTGSGSDVLGNGTLSLGLDSPYWIFRQTATPLDDLAIDRKYAGSHYEVMRIQRSTGNVGIGTTSPAYKLDIKGDTNAHAYMRIQSATAGYDPVLYFADSGGNEWHINYDDTTGTLKFVETGVADRVTFRDGGNVGIGTTSPEGLLDVEGITGTVHLTGDLRLRELGTGNITYLQARDDENEEDIELQIRTQKAGAITTAMRIDADGKVGIGTDDPKKKLHLVDGDFRMGGEGAGSDQGIFLTPNDAGTWSWIANVGAVNGLQIGEGATIGTTPKLTILHTTGYVGIGTASPTSILHISSTWDTKFIGGNQMDFTRDNVNYITASNASGSLMFGTGGRTNDVYIDSTGRVGIGTASPASLFEVEGASPDIRLDATSGNPTYRLSEGGVTRGTWSYDTTTHVMKLLSSAENASIEINPHGTGKVGIGMSNPTADLDVASNIRVRDIIETNKNLAWNSYYDGGWLRRETGATLLQTYDASPSSNIWKIKGAGNGSVGSDVSWSDIMAINMSSGKVGIGTASPGEELEVAGDINSTGGDICITGGNCLESVYIPKVYTTSANYTILDSDGYTTIDMTTGAGDKKVTLPTAADNKNRMITLRKADSGAGKAILDGEGAENINNYPTWEVTEQYGYVTVQSNGTGWIVLTQEGCIYEMWNAVNQDISNSWIDYYNLPGLTPGKYLIEYALTLYNSDAYSFATIATAVDTEDDAKYTLVMGSDASGVFTPASKSFIRSFSVSTTLYLNAKDAVGSVGYIDNGAGFGKGFIRATRIG